MSKQTTQIPPDYLIIGHITRDLLDDGFRLGGTAVYSTLVAKRMGLRVALFTSCQPDLSLDLLEGIDLFIQDSPRTTTFRNSYSSSGRIQQLIDRAPDLDLDLLPENWKAAQIVHLAPIAGELDLAAGLDFNTSPTVYSLQGWLRKWDQNGKIGPASFPKTDPLQNQQAAGFLSIEDLGYDRSSLEPLKRIFPLLVLTHGEDGAEIFQAGRETRITAPESLEIDPTGAGDIFAAAFIIDKVINGRSVINSAQFASSLAALSATRPGLDGLPSAIEIKELQKV